MAHDPGLSSLRLGVEVQVQQDVHVRAGGIADDLQMLTHALEDLAVDVELG